jgi:predicted small metal-binding protein
MGFKKGEDWNGNRNGRPAKPETEILRKALESARKKHGKHLIEHAIEQAYIDNVLCSAILKKILPDKIENDFVDGARIILIRPAKKECSK